ncbi:MAG TPA: DNA polymerase III subunit gamma/tau [Lentisphaeria bacterium]|nr:DNA polymerase III subunit gamma/tau [Lentisphaeria bacterium]HCG50676.1 DNA polymerase III subunit gamma/tau [Lentisphaeria bacterium]
MAYQVTARKWRPQRFSDMVGQEHIARTLKNAIRTGHIAHAYLFVGPRGIGKTTSARIFAKALNCKRPVDGEPCCECSSCKSIADETNVDIIEIDAATHTQVDKAREICEDVLHLPIASKYKIYIIDEVHMLSKSAWNALLKTIEEPPAHAKFIFATTEVNKVLPTVISRCQRFDLRRIPSELIAQRLSYIAHEEKINISPSAINVIARAADGGMRDAQSLLDQLVSFFGTNAGNEEISEAQALSLFGLTAPEEMEELLNSILNNDRAAAILSIHKFAEQGKNLETLFEEVLAWLRGIMLSIILPNPQSVLDENPEKILIYQKLATDRNVNMVQTLLEQLSASSYLLREAINKQIFIETIMLKSMRSAHAVRIEDLLVRLNQIRRNGELDVLAKVPSLAQMPVAQTAPAVHPQVAQTAPPVQIPVTSPSQPVPSQIPHPQVAQTSPQPQVRQTPAPAVPAASVPQMEKPVPVMEKPVEEVRQMTQSQPVPPQIQPEPVPEKETAPQAGEEKKAVSPPSAPPADEKPVAVPSISAAVELKEEEPEDESEDEPEEEDMLSAEELLADTKNDTVMPLSERFSPDLLWEKLVKDVRENTNLFSIPDLMTEGVPLKLEYSTLTVAFDEDYGDIAYQSVIKEKDLLTNCLKQMSRDSSAVLRLIRKKGVRTPEAKVHKKTLDELKREASNIPIVDKTADLFSGLIVDVLESKQ